MYGMSAPVGGLLLRAATERPDDLAVAFPTERLSNAELYADAAAIAKGLLDMGVRRGDHVGIFMPNSLDFVRIALGAALAGAVVVPINGRFKTRELSYVVRQSDVRVLFVTDQARGHVDHVQLLYDSIPGLEQSGGGDLQLDAAPLLRRCVTTGEQARAGLQPLATFVVGGERVSDRTLEARILAVRVRDVGLVMYTSGTTGYPKGCLLTHEALVRTWETGGVRFGIERGDRVWTPLPLYHLGAMGPLILCLALGAAFISTEHFDPQQALQQVADEGVTHIMANFPAVTMAMLNHPHYSHELFRRVRVMTANGQLESRAKVQDLLPPWTSTTSHFGLSECSGTVVANRPGDDREIRLATVGTPLEGMEVRIADVLSNAPVAEGATGEIQVRGFATFEGYYQDPEQSAATLLPDGWVKTGDAGYLTDTGMLVYRDRYKEMLKVGGENVAPSEIESHIATHPAVQVVAVIGVADEKYDQVPVAFIELREGHQVGEEEIIAYCRGQIANFKVPRRVVFVTEWPMSATKIQRFKLQQLLGEEPGTERPDRAPRRAGID